MERIIKRIIIVVVAAGICYATYFIFLIAKNAHHIVWTTKAKDYLYFFKDSIRDEIDTTYSFSYVKKNDIYNHYTFKDSFGITIWAFNKLRLTELKNITFHNARNLGNVKFSTSETFNTNFDPITMEYGFNFDSGMRVCYDQNSKVDTFFQYKNYKALYGNVHKMLLKNIQWEPQVLFDYTKDRQYGLFIFYKKDKRFYILIINSDKNFDPMKLIKIFNLP